MFTDFVILRSLDDTFVSDLIGSIGIGELFTLVYELPAATLHQAELAGIVRRRYQAPIFETLRTRGSEDRNTSPPLRSRIDHEQPRAGRLEWLDIFLELRVSAVVESRASRLEGIRPRDLMAELGEPTSLEELRAALEAEFGESVTRAFFDTLRITTFEEFTRRPKVFLEFVAEALPPFDPADPAHQRSFPLLVCLKVEPTLDIGDALRRARLCRGLLEHERQHVETYGDAEVRCPYAFISLFPESAATDTAIPGHTSAQVMSETRSLFAAEQMAAHFLTGA